MKGLFAPAVLILNRLRYPQKFLLITMLFALPLGVVMVFFLRVVQHDIECSEHEKIGVEYIRPLDAVVQHVQQHRALTVAFLSGAPDFEAQYEAKQLEIQKDIARVDAADRRFNAILDSTATWNRVKQHWD